MTKQSPVHPDDSPRQRPTAPTLHRGPGAGTAGLTWGAVRELQDALRVIRLDLDRMPERLQSEHTDLEGALLQLCADLSLVTTLLGDLATSLVTPASTGDGDTGTGAASGTTSSHGSTS